MLSPLGKVANAKKEFVLPVTLYTLGGLISSSLVGLLVAGIGRLLFSTDSMAATIGLLIAILGGVVSILRELFFQSIPLLQLKRQTPYRWFYTFKIEVTSFLWGLDLGSVFSTYLTLSGIWPLTIGIFAMASPSIGAILFAVYWMGKAATLWLSVYWVEDSSAADEVAHAIADGKGMLRAIHTAGLASSLIGAGVLLSF